MDQKKIVIYIKYIYDGTVRNSFGSIIQFQYGNDNLDPTKIVLKNNKPTICDISRLTNKLNLQFELEKGKKKVKTVK